MPMCVTTAARNFAPTVIEPVPARATTCLNCGETWSLACPECGHEISAIDTKCPHCGLSFEEEFEPCPHCGQPMPDTADICPHCKGERCPTCGAALQANTLVCSQCGTTFVLHCPECQHEIPDGATKCPNCGMVFSDTPPGEGDRCPTCGALIVAEDGVCSACGCTFCPRCLTPTQEEDRDCPKCDLELFFNCPDCGFELLASASICPSCDRLFARTCPHCQRAIYAAPIECPGCHNALPAEKAALARPALGEVGAAIVVPKLVKCPNCETRFDATAGPCPTCDSIVCPKCHRLALENESVCMLLRHANCRS